MHQVNPGPVSVESRRINSIKEGNSRPLMVTHIVLSTAASYQQPDDDRLTRRAKALMPRPARPEKNKINNVLIQQFWLFVVGQKLYFKSIDMPSTKTPLVPFPVLTGCELVLCFPSKSSSKYLPEIRKYFVKIQNPRKNPAAARSDRER